MQIKIKLVVILLLASPSSYSFHSVSPGCPPVWTGLLLAASQHSSQFHRAPPPGTQTFPPPPPDQRPQGNYDPPWSVGLKLFTCFSSTFTALTPSIICPILLVSVPQVFQLPELPLTFLLSSLHCCPAVQTLTVTGPLCTIRQSLSYLALQQDCPSFH